MATQKQMLWVLARIKSAIVQQEVPGWNGFFSLLGNAPDCLTTIDYYPVIASPITNYKTIHECLRYAEQATSEVNQLYIVSTFDLRNLLSDKIVFRTLPALVFSSGLINLVPSSILMNVLHTYTLFLLILISSKFPF